MPRAVLLHYGFELECFLYMTPNVRFRVNFLQECNHVKQLFIVPPTHKRFYRHPIGQVERERNDRIVHNYELFYLTVLNDLEVFHVDAGGGLDAVVTVKSVLDDLSVNVDEVQDCICVVLFTSCEHADFVHA